ncbi:MAG: PAS domain-containing protein, partial [Alphaproteobacteria bacterium]|nr:PAS domain-containing protein [Alphaproteobacteria bacterium]
MDDDSKVASELIVETDEVARFTESYASFNRIINSLQRKYIQLQDEFSTQNSELAEANQKLVDLSERNLAVTQFLDGILNSISAGVIAVDREGRITHFNKAASRILGIPPTEALGKPYRDCIEPGTPIDANALRTVERRHAIESVERDIELPDNTRIQLSVSTAVLYDAESRPSGAVEVFHDLTKIKKMEHELARLNTLAALGEMAATIAHEVRNPLAGIGGFAALLQKDLDADDARQKLVSKIIRGVSSLNDTVTTLLNYTRFDETNRMDTQFGEFIERTIRQYKRDNPDREQLTIRLTHPSAGESCFVDIDPMLFRQVFFNLFTNAGDMQVKRGRVDVAYRTLPRQTATRLYGDRLPLGLDETVFEATVADSGPGIQEEHLDKIFSPFFTTRSSGNGLGLAVAWKILKAHGGDITAENRSEG